MLRSLVALLVLVSVGVTTLSAGSRPKVTGVKEAAIDNENSVSVPAPVLSPVTPASPNGLLNWVIVDSMPNSFGPANDNITPISYDPGTGILGVVYRGNTAYAAGSGELWYSISHDGGLTWRRVSGLNAGTPLYLRYPSCAISNPTGGSDTTNVLFLFGAPGLPGGGFGGVTIGVDPIGQGTPFAVVDNGDTTFASSMAVWSTSGGAPNYWATSRLATGVPNDSYFWETADFINFNMGYPSTWKDTSTNFVNALGAMNGVASSNASYYAVNAAFDTAAIVFGAGVSKTTDGGANWSDWITPRPDWVQATGLPLSLDTYDYFQSDGPGSTVSYLNDFVLDNNDYVHFFTVTVDSPWTATEPRGIIEIAQTASVSTEKPEGTWESHWIKQNLNLTTPLGYPAPGAAPLDQTYNAIHASISDDGQVLTMVWLDMTAQDSLPDIYFSWRNINGPTWSTPLNLSQTPDLAELLLHAAPTVRSNGGSSYTLFLGRTYDASGVAYSNLNNAAKSYFYVAAYTFNAVTSVGEGRNLPKNFALQQNYPNPFNPSTTISFTVPERSDVSLNVYNTLGQQVATVVSGTYEAGTYEAQFSAAHLSSGVYYYTLRAGELTGTKKMVLLK